MNQLREELRVLVDTLEQVRRTKQKVAGDRQTNKLDFPGAQRICASMRVKFAASNSPSHKI
jgi:hypothetical protein